MWNIVVLTSGKIKSNAVATLEYILFLMAGHDSDALLYTTLLFVSILINDVCSHEIGSQILCLGMQRMSAVSLFIPESGCVLILGYIIAFTMFSVINWVP